MTASCICPHCGYNLERERATDDGPFRYDPQLPAFLVDGVPLPCTPQIRQLLGSLMLARGRALSYEVLAERLGYAGDVPSKLVHVLAFRARRLIEARGHRPPFVMVHSTGLRWVSPDHFHNSRSDAATIRAGHAYPSYIANIRGVRRGRT